MRRSLFVCALAAAVAASSTACGGDDASPATTTAVETTAPDVAASPTPGTTPVEATTTTLPADPRAPGVTDDEVVIGIPYFDFSVARNVVGHDNGDYEAAYQAMIDDVNARGGIHGRRLRAVFAPVNPVATDSAAAACTRLTQDEQVFVAVGFFLADSMLCYLETNGTAVIGGGISAERLERASAPWFTTEKGADLITDAVRSYVESGALDGTVGVLSSVGGEDAYENGIKPIFEAAGIEPASVAYLDLSSRDTNTIQGLSQTIAERFQADGVDQVLIVSDGAAGPFPAGVSLTGYRPQLLFASIDGAKTYTTTEGNDLGVVEGALAAGLFDPADEFVDLGGATASCVEVQTAAGLDLRPLSELGEADSRQYVASLEACRNITLLTALLEAAGPDLNYGSFQAAGYGLGEIELPGYPDPWSYGPPPASDGDPRTYLYAWDADGETFVRQDS